MYKRHSEIITPERNKTIWRYMSIEKFLSLLNDRQLYFTRHNLFFDSEEGMRSIQDLNIYNKTVPGISDQIEKAPLGCGYINCWVMSDEELYLMWNTYSTLDKGIAIKSKIGNVIDSLDKNDERWIFISDVNYIDYLNDYTFNKAGGSANDLARFFCKRKSFQQEKELRLVYYDYQMKLNDEYTPRGIKFSVSLDILIDAVYTAPLADEWYIKLIGDEMRVHNINKPIIPSQI